MHAQILTSAFILCLIFTPSIMAQENTTTTSEPAKAQQAAHVDHAKTVMASSFFSWPWFIICLLVAMVSLYAGHQVAKEEITGKQQNVAFFAILFDNLLDLLPENIEAEYEVTKTSIGRAKVVVRVFNKDSDEAATAQLDVPWDDLPEDVQTAFDKSENQNHIQPLKKATDK